MSEKNTLEEIVAVIGLGYVGLPLAVALAEQLDNVLGYDVSEKRIASLRSGEDWTGEIESADLKAANLDLHDSIERLADATAYILTLPTPIDKYNKPDLEIVRSACRALAPFLRKGNLVVLESTVFPGVTEEICGPILEEGSGMASGRDFFLGYSPERINPGDKIHTITKVTKVVSGQDADTLDRVAAIYETIVEPGVYRAPSIKVAEAAKVIENTQRDLNIALMNELSLIFSRVGIATADVLEAAGTKWNFLPFTPGLVGGHCIGVDPYYLTSLAETLDYTPQVILSGRRINDHMGAEIAQRLVKTMVRRGLILRNSRVGILGLTFKENVPDFRNSKVFDVYTELCEFGAKPVAHDIYLEKGVKEQDGVPTASLDEMNDLDALVIAVSHDEYRSLGPDGISAMMREGGVVADVRSLFKIGALRSDIEHWSL